MAIPIIVQWIKIKCNSTCLLEWYSSFITTNIKPSKCWSQPAVLHSTSLTKTNLLDISLPVVGYLQLCIVVKFDVVY